MSGNQLLEDGRPVVLHGEWVEAFPSAFPSQLQHVNKSCLHPYPLPSPPPPGATQPFLCVYCPFLCPACCLFPCPNPLLLRPAGINYFGFNNGQTMVDGLWAGVLLCKCLRATAAATAALATLSPHNPAAQLNIAQHCLSSHSLTLSHTLTH